MRVCWFSTGVSSFAACFLSKDADEIVYTHIDSQHEDSLRFLRDCEAALGRKITALQSAEFKTVDDVLEKKRYINGPGGAACTRLLKRRTRELWEAENIPKNETPTYVWGYDVTETNRAERIQSFMRSAFHEFPLIERGLTKQDAHALCERLGLKRPYMYDLGYPNNNCIGCVKGGMGYWNKIRVDFPEVFARRAAQEREIGHSCIGGVFLDELEPGRGDLNGEVLPECGIYCQIAAAAREFSV
jgi:hypothetical protein